MQAYEERAHCCGAAWCRVVDSGGALPGASAVIELIYPVLAVGILIAFVVYLP